MDKSRILATHECKESKGTGALIRFMPKYSMDDIEDSAWCLGGWNYDTEYGTEYEINYFKIKLCPFCGEVLPPVEIPVTPEGYLLYQESVTLHPNGCNAKLSVNILPERQMREIGFTDRTESSWYYWRSLSNKYDISFNLKINKENPEDWRLDVLDDDFCQPYDYQAMLRKNPRSEIPLLVRDEVEKVMEFLTANGVISGHVKGAYI